MAGAPPVVSADLRRPRDDFDWEPMGGVSRSRADPPRALVGVAPSAPSRAGKRTSSGRATAVGRSSCVSGIRAASPRPSPARLDECLPPTTGRASCDDPSGTEPRTAGSSRPAPDARSVDPDPPELPEATRSTAAGPRLVCDSGSDGDRLLLAATASTFHGARSVTCRVVRPDLGARPFCHAPPADTDRTPDVSRETLPPTSIS